MVDAVIIGVAMMGGLGVLIGVLLAAASKIFYVYVDPQILEVEEALPGANCGGCGFAGCSANAAAIVAGKSSFNSCVAAGPEVALAIAAIMGGSVEVREPDIALPDCTYGLKEADAKFIYNGVGDCRAAALLSGGMKVCSIGCLGLGTCARACPFNAIVMGPQGLPVVDNEKCTGCGTCERVCPKHIIKLSSVTRRILVEYTREDCTTPCQRACPAGINIREYIRQIALGDYHRSIQIIKERNPFPTVIGRICPRPCEQECRRKFTDEPVAINFLKRFAADYEKKTGKRVLPFKAPETGKRIAVVGGGVEGLSTAFFSARLGHDATVFESALKAGGVLRTAISSCRLPQEILDWDIDGILEMGVKLETGKALGRDFTISSLLGQGFSSVFLASGGWDSRLLRGATAKEEVVPGTGLLIDVMKTGLDNINALTCESDVVIAGGGSLALSAAQIVKRMGAKTVTILFRERRDQLQLEAADPDELKGEGISLCFGSAVTRLLGEENHLMQIEYEALDIHVKTVIPAGRLILPAGRLPELIFSKIKVEDDLPENEPKASDAPLRWEGFGPYKQPLFSGEVGFFSEADPLTDFSAAIKAIGAGRRAAASVHQFMYDFSVYLPEQVLTLQSVIQDVDHVENVAAVPRQVMLLSGEDELARHEEIEKGFDETAAKREADRCLKCGLICYRHTGIAEEVPMKKSA